MDNVLSLEEGLNEPPPPSSPPAEEVEDGSDTKNDPAETTTTTTTTTTTITESPQPPPLAAFRPATLRAAESPTNADESEKKEEKKNKEEEFAENDASAEENDAPTIENDPVVVDDDPSVVEAVPEPVAPPPDEDDDDEKEGDDDENKDENKEIESNVLVESDDNANEDEGKERETNVDDSPFPTTTSSSSSTNPPPSPPPPPPPPSGPNAILFGNLNRNWMAPSASELELQRLCFAAFGEISRSCRSASFPYDDDEEDDGDDEGSSSPWIPSEVATALWTELLRSRREKNAENSSDDDDDDDAEMVREVVDALSSRLGFLNASERGADAVPCLRVSADAYEEYSAYALNAWWRVRRSEEDQGTTPTPAGETHALAVKVLSKYSPNDDSSNTADSRQEDSTTNTDAVDSDVSRRYVLVNYPRHLFLSTPVPRDRLEQLLCRDAVFVKERVNALGMVRAVEAHVADCERAVSLWTDETNRKSFLVRAYDAVAKVCRHCLETIETAQEEALKRRKEREEEEEEEKNENSDQVEKRTNENSDQVEKRTNENEDDNDDPTTETDATTENEEKEDSSPVVVPTSKRDIDEVRAAVAESLHLLGKSLSDTFGYNVTVPAEASVGRSGARQDVRFYQEALSLFTLSPNHPAIKVKQAHTLFRLGNCYAWQNLRSSGGSESTAQRTHTTALLGSLSFLPKDDAQGDDGDAPSSSSSPSTSLNVRAMKCYDQSFYLRRTHLGDDHPSVADSIHAIGVLYFEVRNWSHAVGCLDEALRIRRAREASDEAERRARDLDAADALEWIGHCRRESGEPREALARLTEAAVLRAVYEGARHPRAATLAYKAAVVRDDLGETDAALEGYRAAAEVFRGRGDSCLREVERCAYCEGSLHKREGRREEALACLRTSADMRHERLLREIDWLRDETQEDEEARTLPPPAFHNRDNREGGTNRVLVMSTTLDPALATGLLKTRTARDVDRLLAYVAVLDDVHELLTTTRGRRGPRHDEIARILFRKSKILVKLGRYEEATKSLVECKKACWLWEPATDGGDDGGEGLELMVEVRLNGMQARMGDHEAAIQGYRELLNRCDAEDHRTADVLYNIGNSYSTVGESNEALSCLQKCLRVRTTKIQVSAVELANTHYCLGVVYCNLARYDKALSYLHDALTTFTRDLGPDHVHVAHALYYVGQVEQNRETPDLDAAMDHYERALSLFRAHYSPDHIVVGHVVHSIGSVHDVRGDYPKAVLCFTDALRVYKLYNDGEHLGVSMLMNSMGIVSACVKNQNKLAMGYFEEALRIRRKFLGDRHPAVADVIHNIGGVRAKRGDLDGAVEDYKVALDVRREYYGHEHLIVAKTMNNLGIVHTRRNELDTAMGLFKTVLRVRRAHLDPEDEEIATTLYNIGNIHARTGENDLAMVCYEEALRVRRLVFGDSHISVANMLHNLGGVLVDKERYENAIVCLDEALRVKRIELGDDSLSFSYTLLKIGQIHTTTKDHDQALICLNEALRIQKSRLGHDHVHVATALMHVGHVRQETRRYEEALECYEEALHIRELRLGETHEDVGRVFFAMGALYAAREEIEGAMICYGNAARIARLHRGPDDEERVRVTEALRRVVASHSKKNGTSAAFWDTIVVTGDYWLGVEQVLIDAMRLLQRFITEPISSLVRNTILNTVRQIEIAGSHCVIEAKEAAAFNAIYNDGLCLTSD